MSHLAALKSATSLAEVANLIGFKPAALSYILYKKGFSNYKKFEIPKRNGGSRLIAAPADELKLIQRRLAALLQNCVDEISVANNFRDSIAHGFKRRRSIITNAKKHRRRRYVFNIDLTDFFGAINFGRVRGFFIKDKNFALNEKVATVLAQIICFENSLPQGGPCSPVVSNLIGHVLDIHLVRLATQSGCSYTRYADDLTFSTNKKNFPDVIASRSKKEPHIWRPGDELVNLVGKSGFEINPTKTRMQYRASRQTVTGLIVNSKLNVCCEYRHTVRAMVHRLVNTGAFEFVRKVKDSRGVQSSQSVSGTPNQLHGMLGFIDEIDRYNREIKRKNEKSNEDVKLSSKESMYRRFLLFTEFYAAPRPVIVCEGASDNIYILHAIRSLAKAYPKLATVQADDSKKITVRIFKYANSGTGRILGIHSGGIPNLCNLIRSYRKEKEKFKAPGLTHPIILLIDNDNAAKKIYEVIGQISKSKPNGMEDFIHVTGNLYVVPTPYNTITKTSVIEDCFDSVAKLISIDGKIFDPADNKNSEKCFGKMVFAHKVVRKHADTIDFSGFAPVLTRIVSVIETHEKKNTDAIALKGQQP